MDCFYAAVHMRDDPDLAGKPVVVGGDPSGRGVVAAASYEARTFGIHSAMPAAQALRLCPHTVFIRPDFSRYRSEAEKIFAIYREIAPHVQTLSLDEAYLDVSEHLGDLGSATAVAGHIRRRVREQRRLTVSVGVGPNKLVAKIASDFDKPDGLTVVPPAKVEAFLGPLAVRRLYGIGPATERALHEMNVRTVDDLRTLSIDQLINRFGHWGRTLWEHARGIDERPVSSEHDRKSLSTERTFRKDLRDIGEMNDTLTRMANEVATSLERRNLAASTVTIKVRYSDFTTITRSRTLPLPTTDSARIGACARELLDHTDARERSVRLLGVGASNLLPADLEQLALFEE